MHPCICVYVFCVYVYIVNVVIFVQIIFWFCLFLFPSFPALRIFMQQNFFPAEILCSVFKGFLVKCRLGHSDLPREGTNLASASTQRCDCLAASQDGVELDLNLTSHPLSVWFTVNRPPLVGGFLCPPCGCFPCPPHPQWVCVGLRVQEALSVPGLPGRWEDCSLFSWFLVFFLPLAFGISCLVE